MSELTECNACSLRGIEQYASARGATVTTRRIPIAEGGDMAGWYEVRVSDRDEPVAYFMELTVECCC